MNAPLFTRGREREHTSAAEYLEMHQVFAGLKIAVAAVCDQNPRPADPVVAIGELLCKGRVELARIEAERSRR